MEFYSVFACDNYNDIYDVVRKHFEMHKVCDTIPRDAKILIKPNLVTDKEAAFCKNKRCRFHLLSRNE